MINKYKKKFNEKASNVAQTLKSTKVEGERILQTNNNVTPDL